MLLKTLLCSTIAPVLAATLLATGALPAQHAEVPRTRTLPGIASPAFPYAAPEETSEQTTRQHQPRSHAG